MVREIPVSTLPSPAPLGGGPQTSPSAGCEPLCGSCLPTWDTRLPWKLVLLFQPSTK